MGVVPIEYQHICVVFRWFSKDLEVLETLQCVAETLWMGVHGKVQRLLALSVFIPLCGNTSFVKVECSIWGMSYCV